MQIYKFRNAQNVEIKHNSASTERMSNKLKTYKSASV